MREVQLKHQLVSIFKWAIMQLVQQSNRNVTTDKNTSMSYLAATLQAPYLLFKIDSMVVTAALKFLKRIVLVWVNQWLTQDSLPPQLWTPVFHNQLLLSFRIPNRCKDKDRAIQDHRIRASMDKYEHKAKGRECLMVLVRSTHKATTSWMQLQVPLSPAKAIRVPKMCLLAIKTTWWGNLITHMIKDKNKLRVKAPVLANTRRQDHQISRPVMGLNT